MATIANIGDPGRAGRGPAERASTLRAAPAITRGFHHGGSLDATDTYFAHETAVVEPGARVGSGTRVWHHAHVRAGAEIGRECTISKNVYVDAGARIGNHVKIQNNVSVYDGVILHDEVFVGPSAVFTNDRLPRAVGPGWKVSPTVVHRGASIGANATIVCGNEIGEWAAIGAGSVVTRSLEEHELVVGNPARRIGWVCECGHVVSRAMDRPTELRCDECAARG